MDPCRASQVTHKIKTPNKNIPLGVSQSHSQFLATLPTNKIVVTYSGVFKFGDKGPDCLLHEVFDLQRTARPQDGQTDRSDPWILLGSHHRSWVRVQPKPANMSPGEVDATPGATVWTDYLS